MDKAWPVLFLALVLPLFRAEADETTLAGFSFRAPSAWQAVPADDDVLTRLAAWTLPGGAEVAVFRFGGAQQTSEVQANLNRWASSVTTPAGTPVAAKVATRRIGAFSLTQLEAFGTYLCPGSGAPGLPPATLPGYGLVGTVLELPNGPLYVRLTGPEAAVRRAAPELGQFLDSVRPPSVRPPPPAPAAKG